MTSRDDNILEGTQDDSTGSDLVQEDFSIHYNSALAPVDIMVGVNYAIAHGFSSQLTESTVTDNSRQKRTVYRQCKAS